MLPFMFFVAAGKSNHF